MRGACLTSCCAILASLLAAGPARASAGEETTERAIFKVDIDESETIWQSAPTEPLAAEAAEVSPQSELEFRNPAPVEGLEQPSLASEDQVKVGEGLTLFGKLDGSRNTLVYFHGWTPSGKAYWFPYADTWQKGGFNVLLFRWHRAARDLPPPPTGAQRRIYRSVADEAFKEVHALAQRLEPGRELRLVGHSLGSQLAIVTAYRLLKAGFPGKSLRLEILDPYTGIGSRIPKDASFKDEVFKPRRVLLDALVDALDYVRRNSRPAVVYASITGWIFTRPYHKVAHVQGFGAGWLSASPRAKHNRIRDFYFRSLVTGEPKVRGETGTAFSARLKTEDVPADALSQFLLVSGKDTVESDDDVFRRPRRRSNVSTNPNPNSSLKVKVNANAPAE